MSKVTYNVIYQVRGQVTADIPDDITMELLARILHTMPNTSTVCRWRFRLSLILL